MDNSEEKEKIWSAYNLWKSDLLTNEDFYEMLVKIRGNTPLPCAINQNAITQGQKNYILKLQAEGKIAKSQSLNISKSEAQLLIKEALDGLNRNSGQTDTAGIPINLKVEQEEREKSLYEGGDNY